MPDSIRFEAPICINEEEQQVVSKEAQVIQKYSDSQHLDGCQGVAGSTWEELRDL